MKKMYIVLFLFLTAGFGFSQVDNIANFNRSNLALSDTMPYYNSSGAPANNGIRTVWVADDLDQDGKPEIIATDYSNNGRVHVMEMNGNALEIVWSSPIVTSHSDGSGSTPRWVRTGDFDGDGKGEIVFPLTQGASDFELKDYEWDGTTDNGYIDALTLDAVGGLSGIGDLRTNREVASAYDFDGDGADELITVDRDNNTYILGISGDVPGFGAWQVEGGTNLTAPHANGSAISPGSQWHSVAADINGDGQIDIINHYWNNYAFWSIEPNGPDSYIYPDTTQSNYYSELLAPEGIDGVAYMGLQPVDVDGDGKDEIAGIIYNGNFDLGLISFNKGDDPMYSWDTTKFAIIGQNLWDLAGKSTGSFWGIGAADLNGNGREEILVGGSNGYNIVSVEYNGSGNVLDPNNYTKTILYPGEHINNFSKLAIRDSSGVVDTVAASGSETPFISKMFAGSDINGNGKPEVIASYQSVFDSITYVYQHWDGSSFVDDSTSIVPNPDQVTVRLLESDGATGIKEINLAVVTPDQYKLEQNYPNPFNPTTNIRFTLPLQKKISLKVYDILGNEVKTLLNNQDFSKGSYEVTWDGTNNFGNKVASGQYIYTLKYGNFTKSMKMTLLK